MEDGCTNAEEPPLSDQSPLNTPTLVQLAKTKEEIQRAREAAVQSWLDSMPVIEELETLKIDLLKTKRRVSIATPAASSLESLLKSAAHTLASRQNEERKTREMIEEIQASKEQESKELERLQADIDEEKRAREKLKEELEIKRQSLKAVQLTWRAVNKETKVFGASVDVSIHQRKQVKKDHRIIALPREEYNELRRKAREEKALANWRITASEEQRRAAEARRDSVLRMLEALKSEKHEKVMEMGEGIAVEAIEEEDKGVALEKLLMAREEETASANASPEHQQKDNYGCIRSVSRRRNSQETKRLTSGRHKKLVKKKTSTLQKLLQFLC